MPTDRVDLTARRGKTPSDVTPIDHPTSATNRLYERHDNRPDRPSVTVWMPTSLPWARLQTRAGGCGEPDTLPPHEMDRPIAYLTIGGVQIGGYLADLELQIEAASESLDYVRRYYEELRTAASSPTSGSSDV